MCLDLVKIKNTHIFAYSHTHTHIGMNKMAATKTEKTGRTIRFEGINNKRKINCQNHDWRGCLTRDYFKVCLPLSSTVFYFIFFYKAPFLSSSSSCRLGACVPLVLFFSLLLSFFFGGKLCLGLLFRSLLSTDSLIPFWKTSLAPSYIFLSVLAPFFFFRFFF